MDQPEIRINRKLTSKYRIRVTREGIVEVEAPLHASDSDIHTLVSKHKRWINNRLRELDERRQQQQGRTDPGTTPPQSAPYTPQQLRALTAQARAVIPARVRHYAPIVGVTYGTITIRNQHTRWGSCSAKGNLNFNCLLMLTPPEVLDSVVVHELCHRKEMNHSKQFYALVEKAYPEYRKWAAWLKLHGREIMNGTPPATDGSAGTSAP